MIIYKTTNLINGKIYIGKYSGKAKKYLGSGKLLLLAIKKYGKENFIRETIEEGIEDKEILCEREIYWIKFYDARNLNIGYNLATGGEGASPGEANPMYGKHPSEDTKKKQSDANKGEKSYWWGKKLPDETKQKMRDNHADYSGENHPLFGTHCSDATKTKISNSNKGKTGAMKGKNHTDETKEKISSTLIGYKNPNCSSRYLGVMYEERYKKWRARIYINKKKIHLGYFKYEIEAAMAYNDAALEFYGWKAKLNEISQEEIEALWLNE